MSILDMYGISSDLLEVFKSTESTGEIDCALRLFSEAYEIATPVTVEVLQDFFDEWGYEPSLYNLVSDSFLSKTQLIVEEGQQDYLSLSDEDLVMLFTFLQGEAYPKSLAKLIDHKYIHNRDLILIDALHGKHPFVVTSYIARYYEISEVRQITEGLFTVSNNFHEEFQNRIESFMGQGLHNEDEHDVQECLDELLSFYARASAQEKAVLVLMVS